MRNLAILAAALLAGCAIAPHKTTHRLAFDDGICSGTAVGRHTLLSASHCFAGEHSLSVDGNPVEVIKIITDGADHALVTVSVTFEDVAVRGQLAHVGDHVYYWGNPAGIADMYREGYVSGVWVIGGKSITLLSANGFFGDSGAGVFDTHGQLIGVVSVMYQTASGGYLKFMGLYPLKFTAAQWASIR